MHVAGLSLCSLYLNSVHVWLQLLKTMKQALLKQTADEVRQSKPSKAVLTKAAAKVKQKPQRQHVTNKGAETGTASVSRTSFHRLAMKLATS